MIYITGDIHGSISMASRFNSKNFPEGRALTKQVLLYDDRVRIV